MANERAIICVDDEALLVMSLKLELSKQLPPDVSVETSMHPAEAVELAKDLMAEGVTVALLVTDWVMPGLSGDELIRAMRTLVPGLPVIVMTGHADDAVIRDTIGTNGPVTIIGKPWQQRVLFEAVQPYLFR